MSKILVTYFSVSGQTEKLANTLAKACGADLSEIKPQKIYTEADLNWMDKKSRSTLEMQDRNARPEIVNNIDVASHDVIFVGFPIWWYREPSIIDTFMESYDFSNKTIIPFATSGGSGLGDSASNMQDLAPTSKVLNGKKFSANASESELKNWIKLLNI